MVPTSGRNFQRPFSPFLPFDIAQVHGLPCVPNLTRLGRRNRCVSIEMLNRVMQRAGGDHLSCPDPRGLGPGCGGAQKHPLILGGGKGGGQRPKHTDQSSIKRQLPQRNAVFGHV